MSNAKGRANAFTLVEIMIVIVIIGLLAAMAIPAFDKVRNGKTQEAAEYSAWCKLAQRKDINIEEWRALKQARLLPGQPAENTPVILHQFRH